MNSEVDDLRDGVPRPSAKFAVTVCGAALIVGGIILTNLSITGSYDSPCESILSSNAVWATESSCGIAHTGTLAIVIALLGTGIGLILLGRLSSRGQALLRVAGWLATVVAGIGVVATGLLALRVATYDEPVLRRGWTAVRDASAVATVGLCVAAVVVAACHPARRRSSNATG